ncbi:Trans-aconitate 3-methyltransferase [Paramyrothecium foliicola]|nr:Trans-aconitate 3-methyltransferase [Paramyrothecium foliicola]
MSVFGRATFSAAGYAAFRPTYPSSLFKKVIAFHNAPSRGGTLLDLGCGHGLIARELSPSFDKVIATDPSAGMVKQAAQMTADPKVTFRQCGAEDLSFLPDDSVDMVVSGQAAHWFDYSKAWPELARVVKRGGSLAFWGYRDNVLVGHKRASEIFLRFCYGSEEVEPGLEGMNKYWERPGRDIVRNLLRDVEPSQSEWKDIQRILCDIKADTAELPDPETAWLQQRITLGGLEGYLHTFSAVQGWKDAHPERKSRAEGGDGDLVDIMMDQIVASEPQWKAMGDKWRDAELDTVWGTYILLARRI